MPKSVTFSLRVSGECQCTQGALGAFGSQNTSSVLETALSAAAHVGPRSGGNGLFLPRLKSGSSEASTDLAWWYWDHIFGDKGHLSAWSVAEGVLRLICSARQISTLAQIDDVTFLLRDFEADLEKVSWEAGRGLAESVFHDLRVNDYPFPTYDPEDESDEGDNVIHLISAMERSNSGIVLGRLFPQTSVGHAFWDGFDSEWGSTASNMDWDDKSPHGSPSSSVGECRGLAIEEIVQWALVDWQGKEQRNDWLFLSRYWETWASHAVD